MQMYSIDTLLQVVIDGCPHNAVVASRRGSELHEEQDDAAVCQSRYNPTKRLIGLYHVFIVSHSLRFTAATDCL